MNKINERNMKLKKVNANVTASMDDRLGLNFLSGTLEGSIVLRIYSSDMFASILVWI